MRRSPRSVAAILACSFCWVALLDPTWNHSTLLAGQALPDGPSFEAPMMVLDAGDGLQVMATGDFNEDGVPDLAAARWGQLLGAGGLEGYGTIVEIAVGRGDGSFDAARTVAASGGWPSAIASADVNRDGHLDLLVLIRWETPAAALVLEGDGEGRFTGAGEVEVSTDPNALAVGDLDGDGAADLAIAVDYPPRIALFHGNGDGTFVGGTDLPTPNHPTGVALTDLDRDGHLDLAVSCYSRKLTVFYGDGGGGFGGRIDVPTGFGPTAIAVGDLNEDGRPDLVVPNGGAICVCPGEVLRDSTLTIYYTGADGRPGVRTDITVGLDPTEVAISDTNRDGHLDLSIAHWHEFGIVCFAGAVSPSGVPVDPVAPAKTLSQGMTAGVPATVDPEMASVRTLLGHGDGTFTERSRYRTGSATTHILAADLTSDGIPDLLNTNSWSASITSLVGRGDGTFGRELVLASGLEPVAVAGADLDRDGLEDIVAANRSAASVSVWLARLGPGFERLPDLGTGPYPTAIATSDLNVDGNADIAVAWFGNADSSFTTPGMGGLDIFLGSRDGRASLLSSFALEGRCNDVAVGEFNGDGLPDLAVSSWSPAWVRVLLSDGRGGFEAGPPYPLGWYSASLIAADIDTDGLTDLVASTSWGHDPFRVLLGQGDGTFRLVTEDLRIDFQERLASQDFNEDGFADLATASALILGRGDGTFQRPQPLDGIRWNTGIATADFDADGHSDLALSGKYLGAVSILAGAGDGTFGGRRDYGMGGLASAVAAADVTGDGSPDLILADVESNLLHIFVNRRPGVLPARAFLPNPERTLPLGAGPPRLCVAIEPATPAFRADAIDASTIALVSAGTGSVSSIATAAAKVARIGDSDRNGVEDLSACFTREDLALLFGSLRGRREVHPSIEGVLLDGRSFRAPLDLTVVATGRITPAHVSPNPFNPTGVLAFEVTRAGPVTVRIYDVSGRLVRTVWDSRTMSPGRQEAILDGRDDSGRELGSGVYFYRIDDTSGSTSGRFAILK